MEPKGDVPYGTEGRGLFVYPNPSPPYRKVLLRNNGKSKVLFIVVEILRKKLMDGKSVTVYWCSPTDT